jgi:hypothetical protein
MRIKCSDHREIEHLTRRELLLKVIQKRNMMIVLVVLEIVKLKWELMMILFDKFY